jgi:tetratricopeptide (TPR) repeat protein
MQSITAMDRSAIFACALLIAPVALATGCGSKQPAAPAEPAPLILAELQQLSPGPWRHPAGQVAPTSLERPVRDFLPPANVPTEAESLRQRMSGPAIDEPLEGDVAAPVPAPVADPLSEATEPVVGGPELPDVGVPSPAGESLLPDIAPELVDPAQPSPAAAAPADEPARAAVDAEARSAVPRTLEGMISAPVLGEPLPSSVPVVEQRGRLPWAVSVAPSAEMRAVLEQAEVRLKEGFRLAERGAMRLARAEFVAALELIAQANDAQRGTQFYSESLAAGLVALEESADFNRPKPIGKSLDLERIVSGHRTRILSSEELRRITPVAAARRYYAYAQEQLAGASTGEPRCSIALFGLGKLAIANQQEQPARRLEFIAQAMVLYQAALMADGANYRAANELGVILAMNGHLPQAKKLFVHSAKLSPHPSTFRNLAFVHTRLGEPQLAQFAANRAQEMERAGFQRIGPPIQWVDPVTFAGTTPPSTDAAMPPVAQKPVGAPTGAAQAPVSTADKEGGGWFPWKSRR